MNQRQMWEALVTPRLKPDTQIRMHALVIGTYYRGEGRFAKGIAFWDGHVFRGFGFKFGQWVETTAEYGERGFTPLERVGGHNE